MPSAPAPCRVAELHLRTTVEDRSAKVYWPGPTGPPPRPLLLQFEIGGQEPADDFDALCRRLCRSHGFVVLSVRYGPRSGQDPAIVSDAMHTLEWAADHASALDADPARLLVEGRGSGGALAESVRRRTQEFGWPPLLPPLPFP
ncbi:alpha/beta hydrolase fold domain-containing protein [Nocardia sp. NPDC049737]|uniref:alpha/beta hydrolase n=1 Tax=Nocardia sp. NPDC049737 TaxID=3154358 RepID=UPI00344506E8